jgi:hypothetical protein
LTVPDMSGKIEHVFESSASGDPGYGDVLPVEAYAPDPVDDVTWAWELEELLACDPDRPRGAGEVVAEAGRLPVAAALGLGPGELNPAVLSDADRVGLLVMAERGIAHLTAVKLAAVAALAGPAPSGDRAAGVFAWCEVAAALKVGEGAARGLVEDARALRDRLPRTLALLRAGEISWAKARTVLDATAALDAAGCAAVEELVAGKAAGRSQAAHTAAVARAVRKVDPDGWQTRRDAKLADVALVRRHHGDGVADVLALNLDSYAADLLWTAADTWARTRKAAGDPRTLPALRVAALVDWATDYLTPTHPATDPNEAGGTAAAAPSRGRQPAVVNIVIGLPDLLDPARGGAATIAGSGQPLPADAVADMLHAGARIRFALVDTTGTLVGISTGTHDIPALTRVFVALRDLVVRVPSGSTLPVTGQDLDHPDPHGPGDPGNLHGLTRGWHRAKTFGHWQVRANPDTTITWTSTRTGRTYTTHPWNHRDGP